MTFSGEPARLAMATLALGALAAGCSAAQPVSEADTRPTATASSRPSTLAAPSRSASPTGAPKPGDLSTPATHSGSLSQRSFPKPAVLGAGWKYSVDAGDAEEGYLGNGTPALARDPQELVQAALPLGCPRTTSLPRPQHALEVDYTYLGTKVVTVRMSFADSAEATTFHEHRRAALDACRGRSGGPAVGRLVTTVTPVGRHALLSDRTPGSDPWSELAVLDGHDVVLVASHTGLGAPPLDRDGVRALARKFRR